MAEYSAIANQTINPGESVIFTLTPVPCNRGLIMHRDGSGVFILSGYTPFNSCCPCRRQNALYFADFSANIAVPTGQTPGQISVAFALEGSTLQDSVMSTTPAVVEEFFNVSKATNVPVFRGCCESFSVRNVSDIPIIMSNANLVITRPDLVMSY